MICKIFVFGYVNLVSTSPLFSKEDIINEPVFTSDELGLNHVLYRFEIPIDLTKPISAVAFPPLVS